MSNLHHNVPEYSVSEVSGAIKQTIESSFGYVRIRGEISGAKRASSGHWYFNLKDDRNVLKATCWKGVASRLQVQPEDGLEVVCIGKITTYGGQSTYQISVDNIELAGQGALLALLEKRKKALAAEGLFDESRKKKLPYIPDVIGVISSPTGAVIRDIMHRLSDRFPRHVILWPVPVQGKGAEDKISAAIHGFNNLPDHIPTPDVLIVARGGGSLEDLMPFNEENVIRAVAASNIPVISAVGHETDTTLIDYVSDRRAPTPTAGAEMAVPVRAELYGYVQETGARLTGAMNRYLELSKANMDRNRLPHVKHLLENAYQKFDERADKLQSSYTMFLQNLNVRLTRIGAALRTPHEYVRQMQDRLQHQGNILTRQMDRIHEIKMSDFSKTSSLLRPKVLTDAANQNAEKLERQAHDLTTNFQRRLEQKGQALEKFSSLLESYSHKKVLERGFALIQDEKGDAITSAQHITSGDQLSIILKDGTVQTKAD